jgi:hypothetical protein
MLSRRFVALSFALFGLVALARAQWVPYEPVAPPTPDVYLSSGGIVDRGRYLELGASQMLAVDPSAHHFYGQTLVSGTSVATRWSATGVQQVSLPTATGFSDIRHAADNLAYGIFEGESPTGIEGNTIQAFVWSGSTATNLTPTGAYSSYVQTFQGSQAGGWASFINPANEIFTQAQLWNGTAAVNLHTSNGFSERVNTVVYAIDGNRAAGTLDGYTPDGSTYFRNAILWTDGVATNLHTSGNVAALGFAYSNASYVVGDYVFGHGDSADFQTTTNLVWHNGQAQTLSSFLNLPGAFLSTVDALGNLAVYDASGNAYNFAYVPNLGITPQPGYAGPYFGEGFGGTRTLVYENDFETNANGFNRTDRRSELVRQPITDGSVIYDDGTSLTLGRFSNEAVTLTLDNLVAGEEYRFTGSLLLGGSWDGTLPGIGPDFIRISADGNILFENTYNLSPNEFPVLVGFGPDLSGLYGGSNVNGILTEPAIRFTATSSTATLLFQAPNSEADSNAWWSLDNVQVTGKRGNAIPEPGTLALVLLAPLGLVLRKKLGYNSPCSLHNRLQISSATAT